MLYSEQKMMSDGDSYIIVGAGVFGASTALELARSGHHVVVLERSSDGYHAVDAASNDLNKIVRPDYSDPLYRYLARRAISLWRRSPILQNLYHETGVLFHSGHIPKNGESIADYIQGASKATSSPSIHEIPFPGQSLKRPAYLLRSEDETRHCFPDTLRQRTGQLAVDIGHQKCHAYFNPRAGWGEADRATRAVLDEAKRLGVQVIGSTLVTQLIFDEHNKNVVKGVESSDGRQFKTRGKGQVILCAGAWARSLLCRMLDEQHLNYPIPTWPSAQCVVALQLNQEQRRAFRGAPVVLDFSTGFYLFEPDEQGVMKIAIHSSGYRFPLPPVLQDPQGFPSFATSHASSDTVSSKGGIQLPHHLQNKEQHIPQDKLQVMLQHLHHVYPELVNAPVLYTRVCFYSESQDENWIIDHVPQVRGLMLASGDSGHAFKFLPLLGSLVCARLGLTSVPPLTNIQSRVWSFHHHINLYNDNMENPRSSHQGFNAKL